MPAVRSLVSFFSLLLLMAGVVLLWVPSAAARTPESVVLVLKLVSSTHVRPTTGVVISNDGMVLVAADFVAAGDEIIIMQGGTDIIRNGRPSRTVKRSAADGLAVLEVEGLKRPAIILSEDRLLQDHVYHMAAFPPADKMAQGAEPLWVTVKLTKSNSTGGFSVSAETPLPDTTGPIIDNCGYLVGLNLAEGEETVVVLGDEMSVLFDSMDINLHSSTCRQPARKEVVVEEAASEEPADLTTITPEPNSHTAPARQTKVASPPSVLGIVPAWLWLIGAVILVALLVKLIFFLRLTKHKPSQITAEPATGPLNPASGSSASALPDGFDGIVIIEGLLGDETPFRHACNVNTSHIDVVIGRGDADLQDADLQIESPSVSDRHVRLKSAGESLTITDLGSGNGTFIRGIPCLANEVMFVGSQDEVLLGDVRFHIKIQAGSLQTSHGDPK